MLVKMTTGCKGVLMVDTGKGRIRWMLFRFCTGVGTSASSCTRNLFCSLIRVILCYSGNGDGVVK